MTIGEVRCSPDLRHANVFCIPLGDQSAEGSKEVAEGLNRAAAFLRGKLGREIEMKFTPQLHFLADVSYDAALAMDQLLGSDRVKRDVEAGREDSESSRKA